MGGGTSSKSKLGKIALQQRLVRPEELDGLRSEEQRTGRKLAPIGSRLGSLVIPSGLATTAEEHDVSPVVLAQLVIRLSQLVLVPEEIAREHLVLPFEATRDRVLLAMAAPWDADVVEEMEFLIGKGIEVYLAERDDLLRAIAEAYAAHAAGEALYAGHQVSSRERETLGIRPTAVAEVSQPGDATATPPVEAAAAPAVDGRGQPDVAPPEAVAAEPRASGAGGEHGPVPSVVAVGAPAVVGRPHSEPKMRAVAPTAVGSPGADGVRESGEQPSVRPVATVPQDPGEEETGDAVHPEVLGAHAEVDEAAEPPRLDAAFSEPPMAVSSPELSRDLSHAHLLVADGTGDTADALTAALAATRLRLTCVDAGKATMAAIRDGQPNLLVLDARLPEVNGLDVCRRIRASERFSDLPIILFSDLHTGWRFEADLRDCFAIQALFEKPLDLPKLTRTVVGLLAGEPIDDTPSPLSPEAAEELNQGMVAFEQGDLESAIAHLEAGVALDPQAFQLQYHLGLLYGRCDSLFSAIQALETAARLQRRHFSALKNLAVVYQRVGFRRKALETWERTMWAAPDEATRTTIKEHMRSLL